MKSRRQRRQEAGFEPQYNGKAPISFAEYVEGFSEKVPARIRKSPLFKGAK